MHTESEHTPISRRLLSIFTETDNLAVKVTLGVVLTALIALMYPHGESVEYSYAVGNVWTENDLVAPFSFPIYKDLRQYEKERSEAGRGVMPVYALDELIASRQVDSLSILVSKLKQEDPAGELSRHFSRSQQQLIRQWRGSDKSQRIFDQLRDVVRSKMISQLSDGIVDVPTSNRLVRFIASRRGNFETILDRDHVHSYEAALSNIEAGVRSSFGSGDTAFIALQMARAVLRPNLVYDKAETDRAFVAALDAVPRTVGFVQAQELIISKGERITGETKRKLDSYQRVKVARSGEVNEVWHSIGIVLHVGLILGLFSTYLFLFRKKIIHDNGKLALIALLVLLECLFTYIALQFKLSLPTEYLILVPAASMLLTIMFDSRVAFYGTVTMSLLIGTMTGNDYAITFITLIGGTLSAYTVRDIRSRTQIFRSIGFIFIGYGLPIIALSIERFETIGAVAVGLSFAFANAVLSPLLAYGLLIFFERIFRVTTDLTLLGLADFNQPLMRELSEKAPGTFHHSLMIGNLAEAAAEAIGANPILARVGAYYHDIGKMLKPEYFIENQVGSNNKHTRLRARMSALIIAAHVKEGVDLGREHGLPEKVLDFIPQHHGTTVMAYFYDKALKQGARRPSKETVNVDDFRYPGPKPQTKETGIVMLADSVEASTRSLAALTPQSLEAAIESMMRQRFMEGQLDECDLTLRDLSKIKDEFLKILLGVHHQRIQYPDQQSRTEIPTMQIEQPASVEVLPARSDLSAVDGISTPPDADATPATPPT